MEDERAGAGVLVRSALETLTLRKRGDIHKKWVVDSNLKT